MDHSPNPEAAQDSPAFAMRAARFQLGASYYPDEVEPERWRSDVAQMRDAGLSVVRLVETAWHRLEPLEGQFDFSWVDEMLNLFGDAGIGVVLGTPTAEPPAWLIKRYPDISRVESTGQRVKFGYESRYCLTGPAFNEAARRVAKALAERYGGDERVKGWQIDNELNRSCYCERCEDAFRRWVQERYGDIGELNRAWGTAYRSKTYNTWEEIPLPDVTLPWQIPAQALDVQRFQSDLFVAFTELQVGELRPHIRADQFVTANMLPLRKVAFMDYHDLYRRAGLDLVTFDNYPGLDVDHRWPHSAFELDMARGMGDQFWCVEQQAGPLGERFLLSPHPREPRLWQYQAIAHGSRAGLYWPWRTPRFGGAQHWHGVIEADGRPGKRFAAISALAGELTKLEPALDGLRPEANAAVLFDYEAAFAYATEPTNDALTYLPLVSAHHEALATLGLAVDVVGRHADLSRFRIVSAPNLFLMDNELASRLADYVQDGGVLVLAARIGARDRSGATPERPLPAWLDELAGVELSDIASVTRRMKTTATFDGVAGGEFHGWYEELNLKGAEAVATYIDGLFEGSAAVTRNPYGDGVVYYIAGVADAPTLASVYRVAAAEAGTEAERLPEGVESVRARNHVDEHLRFILNHNDEPVVMEVGDVEALLVDGTVKDGSLTLEQYGVGVFRLAGSAV